MSRIGKYPVPLPKGVTAQVTNGTVAVKGPKGDLKLKLVPEVTADVQEGAIAITPREQTDRARAMWGMQRTLVNNLVKGVTDGYTEKLEISGVGYRAAVQGKNLNFNAKDVFHIKNPHDIMLPKLHVSSSFVFAKSDSYFVYPNNYNHFVNFYNETFQHGGVSLEEMIIPVITYGPK